MNARIFGQNQREFLGDVRDLGWIAHWPKQNTWTHTHTHTHIHTHTVLWSSFCPLIGFFLSPDYMTPCPVAEYSSEVMS